MNIKFTHFLPAICWLLISIILLSIPGNDLPHADLFDIPFFDKYIHFGMFLMLSALFCIPIGYSSLSPYYTRSWFVSIALYAVAFGIAMEFVQKYLVPNRSFDVTDVLFDAIGAASGALVAWRWYKKIGPDRNRGRNQN